MMPKKNQEIALKIYNVLFAYFNEMNSSIETCKTCINANMTNDAIRLLDCMQKSLLKANELTLEAIKYYAKIDLKERTCKKQ